MYPGVTNQKDKTDTFYPLSHPQMRILYSEEVHPHTTGQSLIVSFMLKGKYEQDKLEAALDLVVSHTDALNFRISQQNQEIGQYRHPFEKKKWDILDFTGEEEKMQTWILQKTKEPLSVYDSCLYEFSFYKNSQAQTCLLLNAHHLVIDAFSWNLLIEQVLNAYNCIQKSLPYPYIFAQYASFLEGEALYKKSQTFDADGKYWLDKYSSISADTHILPKEIKQNDPVSQRKTYTFSESETAEVFQIIEDTGTSIFKLFLALSYTAFHKITGKNQLILGAPLHNRFSPAYQEIIGMFVNMVPFRIAAEKDTSFLELLNQLEQELKENIKHQAYPYDTLIKNIREASQLLEVSELFDVVINYQNSSYPEEIERVDWHHSGYNTYPLSIHISKRGINKSLVLEMDYQTSRFMDLEIDILFLYFKQFIKQLSSNPASSLSSLSLHSEQVIQYLNSSNTLIPQVHSEQHIIWNSFRLGEPGTQSISSNDLGIIVNQKEKERIFWSDKLDSHRFSFFNSLSSNTPNKQFSHQNFVVAQDTATELIKMSNESDQRLHILLSTSVLVLFHAYSSSSKLAIGTTLLSQDSYKNLVNTCLPIYGEIESDDSYKDVLLKVIQEVNQAIKHQNFPIEYFLRQTAAENPSQYPGFEVKVYLENIQKIELPQYSGANFHLYFRRVGQQIQGKISYNSQTIADHQASKLLKNLSCILKDLSQNVQAQIKEFEVPYFNRYKFCLIGDNSISYSCAESLIQENHTLSCIISNSDDLKKFALKHNIPFFRPKKSNLAQDLEKFSYDFCLNLKDQESKDTILLPGKILRYHDSLLPQYPGFYSTTRAILNQEVKHGISWYLSDQEKSLQLYKQVSFDVSPDETSYSLNLKCANYVLSSFTLLLDELACRKAPRETFSIHEDSSKNKTCTPYAAGIISFASSAEEIHTLVRALNFGQTNNPLSTAKIAIGEHLFVPEALQVLPEKSEKEAGEVVRIGTDHIVVATETFDIKITAHQSLTGGEIARLSLYEGMNLSISAEKLQEIDRINQEIASQEDFWIKSLQGLSPLSLGLALETGEHSSGDIIQKRTLKLPGKDSYKLSEIESQADSALLLLSAFLYRISGNPSFAIQYQDPKLKTYVKSYRNLFADYVPFKIQANPAMNFEDFAKEIYPTLQKIRIAKSFQQDVFYRYKTLEPFLQSNKAFSNIKFTLSDDDPADLSKDPRDFLHMVLDTAGEELTLFFNEKTLKPELAEQILTEFQNFTQHLLSQKQTPLVKLPVLSPYEQDQILYSFNDTQSEFSEDKTLSQLFEESVSIHRDRTALVYQDRKLTYGELNSQANKVAHALIKQGVLRGDHVAIMAERSPEMLVSILGVLKAGAVYIPIDLGQPENRIKQILNSVEPNYALIYGLKPETLLHISQSSPFITVFLNLREASSLLYAESIPLMGLEEITQCADTDPKAESSQEDLAYVIHTSGSTGVPKGVVVKHRPVVNVIEWVNKTYKVNPEDKLLFITSIGFDLSVYDVFGTLAAGASIHIARKDEIQDPRVLAQLIPKHGISIWDSTPGTLNQVLPYLSEIAEEAQHFRLAMLSGDWIPLSLPPSLQSLFKHIHVLGMGGATEATIWSNYFDVYELNPAWKSVPYGKPIQNCSYYILDKYKNVCPIHIEGDLYIGGTCVAEGYLNKPELTHDRFVENPYLPGQKIYKTGDRARWYNDGNMEFLGRVDHQIKLRGFRVELGEIESQMLKYPGIDHAVIIVKNIQKDKRLFAYYTASKEISPLEVKTHLKDRLPAYMIPAQLLQIDTIPITAIGKVDREALVAIDAPLDVEASPGHTQLSEIGKGIVKIWKEVLGVKQIKLSDNFFELGGHSFLVIQVSNIMESTFGKEPRFVNFTNRTLAEFIQNYELESSSSS